jgi:hypothetical protein
MTYFINYIRRFGAADGYNLLNKKAAYKYTVKAY